MDEQKTDHLYSYVNSSVSPAPQPEAPLTWRDAVGPAAAVILALLYWRVFALEYMTESTTGIPGLGIPVFVTVYFAAVFLMLGKRLSRDGIALMAAALLLAVSCALYAHPGLAVLNCFVILTLSAMATFALSGQSRYRSFSPRALPEAIRLSVLALFTRIDRPFKVARKIGKDNRGALLRALPAALGTLVLLVAVLALLASADMVFGSFFDGLRRWLDNFALGTFLWRIVRTAALALFIASGLCFIREPTPEAEPVKRIPAERRAPAYLAPVLSLDLVYIIFCAIQLRYLFGGAEAAAMAGGWAEYARTGFFQLAAVAAINLILCVLSARPDCLTARGGLVLRIGSAVMLVLTALILASALYRMGLYIAAYGLSILRLMTLWGMLVIVAGLLLAGWKLYKPSFAFYPTLFAFALATWCLFCLSGPAGRVADYNVDAYLDGRLAEVDAEYLYELNPDAAPALRRLAGADDSAAGDARMYLDRMAQDAHSGWNAWPYWTLSLQALE